MTVTKEYKLGLLVVIGVILVFLIINLFKSGLNIGQRNEFYAVFDDATGLKVKSQVQLNGVKIGEVLEVGLHPANPTLILTKFSIENADLKVPRSSEAWLLSTDLLGTKCIDLRMDLSDTASAELLRNGDTLNSKKELTLEEEFKLHLAPLQDKTEKLIGRVENIIFEINQLWDSSASYTFEESVYKAREAIGTYKQLVSNLIDLINRETQLVTNITANVKTVKDGIMQNMNSMNSVAANIVAIKSDFSSSGLLVEIAEMTVNMSDMNALIKKVNNGEGTLGALTKTTEFKDALKSTRTSLDLLLKNITANPMKYVGISIFGKKIEGLILTPEEEKLLEDWLSR